MYKSLYQNKSIVIVLQTLTIGLILTTDIELTLRIMLAFGYFMLFRQERWHKHILIMFLMILILFVSSQFMIKSTIL